MATNFYEPHELVPEQLAAKINHEEAKEARLQSAVDQALLQKQVSAAVAEAGQTTNPVFGRDFT